MLHYICVNMCEYAILCMCVYSCMCVCVCVCVLCVCVCMCEILISVCVCACVCICVCVCTHMYMHISASLCISYIFSLKKKAAIVIPHSSNIRREQHRIHAGQQYLLHPTSGSDDISSRNSHPHLRAVRRNISLRSIPAAACEGGSQRGRSCFHLPSLLQVVHLQDLTGEP